MARAVSHVVARVAARRLPWVLVLGAMAIGAWTPTRAQDDRGQVRDVARATAGTGVIRGRIVRGDTGQPLAGVTVRLRGRAQGVAPSHVTDFEGRFVFGALQPGSYEVGTTQAAGFVWPTARIPGPVPQAGPFDLTAGQTIDVPDIVMIKGGVVAGYVVDEHGNEVAGAEVDLLRLPAADGSLLRIGVRDETDDRGQFRLFGIPSGTFIVAVQVRDPFGTGLVTAFHPNTYNSAEARSIDVQAGQEVRDLGIMLANVPHAVVSGAVHGFEGPIADGVHAVVAVSLGARTYSSTVTAPVRSDGSYAFPSLPAGDYVLAVSQSLSGAPERYARALVRLGGQGVVVPLTLRSTSTVRGRYVFDASVDRDSLQVPRQVLAVNAMVAIEPDLTRRPSAAWNVSDDWRFTVPGLGGRYLMRPPAPAGTMVSGITLSGRDITDEAIEVAGQDVDGIEVQLTKATMLSGTVNRGTGQRWQDITVVVFSDDPAVLGPSSRFIRSVRPSRDGRYSVSGLPPAPYLAVAVVDPERREQFDPTILAQWRPRATRLTMAAGEARTLDLAVIDPGILP